MSQVDIVLETKQPVGFHCWQFSLELPNIFDWS